MVGVSVGQGRAGRTKVDRANNDRGKDVVPKNSSPTYKFNVISCKVYQNTIRVITGTV